MSTLKSRVHSPVLLVVSQKEVNIAIFFLLGNSPSIA